MRTHNICFHEEIRKIMFGYPFLFGAKYKCKISNQALRSASVYPTVASNSISRQRRA